MMSYVFCDKNRKLYISIYFSSSTFADIIADHHSFHISLTYENIYNIIGNIFKKVEHREFHDPL